MTVKEYTLTDVEEKLNDIASITLFLSSGSCPKEISFNLMDHLQDEIENLQHIVGFMALYPELKAQELRELKSA
ncbi:RstC protein [Vibrio parahaemolyticus]|uniref:RstC protein n=1 Tax=Vibrio parahaemolyticus TaxID=670 RepID=UPI001124947D|nr:RstC protein [Vibrio parahaemolyticus]EGU0147484.1 RstC protein [Vibrio parahaemolyticus]MDF4939863.1 RstC protein [Vibrio parahaemolyticus]MDF5032278.1 RstC protein [Vibrio parahaemolyticus]TOK31758.1 RstC protein [Vibrio parahaemolyticus]HCG6654760.1 RstC protein [Vibrio parahaemolyticus]